MLVLTILAFWDSLCFSSFLVAYPYYLDRVLVFFKLGNSSHLAHILINLAREDARM